MFQKISKTIDNLMFSYVTFKVINDKKVYDLKLNFLSIISVVFVIVMLFLGTSYALFIKPFFKEEYESANLKYIHQTALFAEYNKTMLEKRQLLKKIKGRFVSVFEEGEIDENISKNLYDCENAYCIMQQTIDNVNDSRTRAIFSIPQGMPANGYIISGFGYRTDPISRKWAMHYGVDITNTNALGTPIKATMTGTVMLAGYASAYDPFFSGYGIAVVIDNGFYKTLYGHLLYAKVKYGQVVRKGDVIGYMGTSGVSTGVHVHYGIIIDNNYIDSLEFVK